MIILTREELQKTRNVAIQKMLKDSAFCQSLSDVGKFAEILSGAPIKNRTSFILNPSSGTIQHVSFSNESKQLCYETCIEDISSYNKGILPGKMSLMFVHNKENGTYALQEIKVSNDILKNIIIEGKYPTEDDCSVANRQELEKAKLKLENLGNKLEEASKLAETLIANKKIDHPCVSLSIGLDDLKREIKILKKDDLSYKEIESFIAKTENKCKIYIDKAAASIKFEPGKRILNKLADIFGFERPFKDVKQVDEIKHTFLEMCPH
ncbi:MAG: hypothetical protein LEGION0398_MBIBDBAK_00211 [Legionellaceae bacterium]